MRRAFSSVSENPAFDAHHGDDGVAPDAALHQARGARPARRRAPPGPEQPAALRRGCDLPSWQAALCAALAGLPSDLGVSVGRRGALC